MSANITERAALVLREIDEALALAEEARPSRTLLPASLRCIKTAIEGLIEAGEWIAAAQDDALSAEAYTRAERYRQASEECSRRIAAILDTWEATK